MRHAASLFLPLLLSLAACSPSQAAELTPSSLARALETAKPGAVLTLTPGQYGALKLDDREGLTLRGGRDVVFASIQINRGKKLRLEGFTVKAIPDATWSAGTQAVRIAKSDDVTLSGLLIEGGLATTGIPQDAPEGTPNKGNMVIGLPAGKGVGVDNSNNVTIEKSEIRSFFHGINVGHVRGLKILDNDIHDLRTTPIRGGDMSDTLIARNHAYRSIPWRLGGRGDHGDFIHIWTMPRSQTGPTAGIRIVDNLWEQRDGAAPLGIYLDDNNNNLGFVDTEITGNVIINSDGQGIRLERVSGVVKDNVLLWGGVGNLKQHPRIGLHSGSSNLVITGNRANAVALPRDEVLVGITNKNNKIRPTERGEPEAAVKAWLARFRPAQR